MAVTDHGKDKLVLSSQAYEELPPGKEYEPVIPAADSPSEFTWRSVLIGIIVGVVFGFANAYLGLKVGLVVSASIPAAVVGVLAFKGMRCKGGLLETNLVQTVGSAGEAVASGVIFTLPVLLLWGGTAGFWPVFPLSLLGGLLGVFFMIPLRRFLIEKQHGRLIYPEGTACAEVLVAAQGKAEQGKMLLLGMVVGGIYSAGEKLFHLFASEVNFEVLISGFRTAVGGDCTAELVGVGFIIGPYVASVMLSGGALGWLVMIPLMYMFGSSVSVPPVLDHNLGDMVPAQVWHHYIRYIGAGAVAFGGLFTLLKSTPTILSSFKLGLGALGGSGKSETASRTHRDLPLGLVAVALLVIGMMVAFLPLVPLGNGFTSLGILAGGAVVVFSFFFVTVASRIVGLVGTSSNPISGMTIATVLVCALVFGGHYSASHVKTAVLVIGALVCIAAAVSGDTSQDLKTGYLLGATPYRQQIGEVIGVVFAALVMSTVLALFGDQIVSGDFKAPQANLIRMVIDGVIDGSLPWGLVLVGMACALCIELLGLPTLAFAVGLYLPLHLAVPVMIGALIRLAVEKGFGCSDREKCRDRGVLVGSGLIAGSALIGVLSAALRFFEFPWLITSQPAGGEVWTLLWFGCLVLFYVGVIFRLYRRA